MTLEETYNIHKKINCVLLFFKSKWLCKKGIHNYRIKSLEYAIPKKEINITSDGTKYCTTYYQREIKQYFKCYCCGKEVELSEK